MGVRLENSSKGGFVILHNSESYLMVGVKSKQHLDTLLIKLKETVLSKSIEFFSQGKYGFLGTKEGCVYRMWMVKEIDH